MTFSIPSVAPIHPTAHPGGSYVESAGKRCTRRNKWQQGFYRYWIWIFKLHAKVILKWCKKFSNFGEANKCIDSWLLKYSSIGISFDRVLGDWLKQFLNISKQVLNKRSIFYFDMVQLHTLHVLGKFHTKISILLLRVMLRILVHGKLHWRGVKLDGMAKCRNLLLHCKLFKERILVSTHGWQFLICCLEVVQVRDFTRYKHEAMSKYRRRCFWKSNNNKCTHLLPTSWGSHQRQFQRNKAHYLGLIERRKIKGHNISNECTAIRQGRHWILPAPHFSYPSGQGQPPSAIRAQDGMILPLSSHA